MKSSEMRKRFFKFFVDRDHTMVPSSSLIPAQDPTLLFANAGMNQFKDVFLGSQKRSYKKAVSIQKCVRAGGKHNDLDNVGFTKRHLTFFEMMGNFSFGDYFKKKAIEYAWDFLTKEMGFPIEKMHVSVHTSDDEAYDIWLKDMKIPKEKIHRLGEDNFWQMGDVGPCGPCTELFVDRGAAFGCADGKGCSPACGCDRFLEVWNLVFMQYDRQEDGTLKPLKQTGVDTGMGLERLASIIQDKDSVYETDLFMPIIRKTEELTGIRYDAANNEIKAAFRVLADHVRSSTMIISDGGAPSNEGRGYVLRKIIRRAALFAQKLTDKNIFPELAKVVIQEYGEIYPELISNKELIVKLLTNEIEKFSVNLVRGQQILKQHLAAASATKKISGQQAFQLYDTYGFPVELVEAAAREKGYTVDSKEFEVLMEAQKAQSGKKLTDPLDHVEFDDKVTTEFTGYKELETPSIIVALVEDTHSVQAVSKNEVCWILTKKSPFFIVGGGQVPDNGWIMIDGQQTPILAARHINGRIAAQIKAPVDLKVGQKIVSIVNEPLRTNAMKNHTATHLLQAALIQLFGSTIKQSGSLVHPDYLRFDFTYHENLSAEDIKRVEDLVNQKIRENIALEIEYMDLDKATKMGVLAFFGEKYNPEDVRVVNVPGFSLELCGGTHVVRTGDIGTFKITDVNALSAGHRRIFAVTGPKAIDLFQETYNACKKLSQQFKVKREEVLDTVEKFAEKSRELEKEVTKLKQQLVHTQIPAWEKEITPINGIPFLFIVLKDASNDSLREISTALQNKNPGLYFMVSDLGDRTSFLVNLSPQLAGQVDLKNLATLLKDKHGMQGGGSKNTLQGGGGKFDTKLKDALIAWLKSI